MGATALNGVVDSPSKGMNGHTVATKSKTIRKRQGSPFRTAFSIIARLLTWYSIFVVLFRCPASPDQLTETSPRICRPYFEVKSRVTPHLAPYYDSYALPYIQAAQPYYNILDSRVITPATIYGKKYGAPTLAKAQAFGKAKWKSSVHPQISKVSNLAQVQYSKSLAPHVDRTVATVAPYYEIARDSAVQTYHGSILPTYGIVQPYMQHGYGVVNEFAVDTGIPYAKWAWTTGIIFLDRTVWPRVRILYGENVEPQLVRIGERLGRYRNGKKLQAAVEAVDISSSASSTSSALSSIASSVAAAHATQSSALSTSSTTVSPPAKTPLTEQEILDNAAKLVATDLKTLQEKFARAADEGSDELEERITEITDRAVQIQAKVGEAHLVELEETIKSELKGLKGVLLSIIKKSSDVDESENDLTAAVRAAGASIKGKAQAVRAWRKNFDTETNSLVSKAAEDTFQIIDHIRDLGLQEIGMRWAWTDGITHKHWTKYHAMKDKFDEWRRDVEEMATAHPGLAKARETSEDIEARAMAEAEDAVKELGRLKQTAQWKLHAGDTSEDWDTKRVPAAAAAAGQKIRDKLSQASEAVMGTSQGTIESITSVASSSVAAAMSSVSSIASDKSANIMQPSKHGEILETPSAKVAEMVSAAMSSASSVAAEASSSIIGTPQGTAESVMSVVQASVSSIASAGSASILGTTQGTIESVTSKLSGQASSVSEKVSSVIHSSEPDVVEKGSMSVSSIASAVTGSMPIGEAILGMADSVKSFARAEASAVLEDLSSASSSLGSGMSSASSVVSETASSVSSVGSSTISSVSSAASKRVMGGVMAQYVEATKIIYEDVLDEDDDASYSEQIQSMASQAGDTFSDITKAVSEALMRSSSTQGSVESVTSLAAKQYSSALSAASVAYYGTQQGTGESIVSAAQSGYSAAVSAASSAIYGTPTPVINSLASQAQSAYSDALSRASEHSVHAMSIVSAQISGTPKPIHEQMFASVTSAYSDSVDQASSKLGAALSAASTAVYGKPPSPQESLLAAASSHYAAAQSYASSQLEAAKTAISGSSVPAHESLLSAAQKSYSDILSGANDQYSSAVARVSSAYSGGALESASAIAASRLSEGLSYASAQYSSAKVAVGATPTPAAQRYLDEAQRQYYGLVGLAHARYSEFIDAASSAVLPTPTPFHQSLYSRASANIVGTEAPWTESVASVASENWEALITKASLQIYGAPTPFHHSVFSQAGEYAAQATDSVAAQYVAVQNLISELVQGKEPDFTESVYSRLSSAYNSGVPAAASSMSSMASEVYASASSVVGAVFTPPPALESILESASSRVDEVVQAASIQYYGTTTGAYEAASSSVASVYSSVSSVASVQMYGSSTGLAESYSSSIAAAMASANNAIMDAIYGTLPPSYHSATSVAGEAYASATSVVADNMASASSIVGDSYSAGYAKVSSVVYGPEQGAVESAQFRLSAAVESARAQLAQFASVAGESGSEAIKKASEGIEQFASSVSSAVESATVKSPTATSTTIIVKDEL